MLKNFIALGLNKKFWLKIDLVSNACLKPLTYSSVTSEAKMPTLGLEIALNKMLPVMTSLFYFAAENLKQKKLYCPALISFFSI